jgi:hypothetical protein
MTTEIDDPETYVQENRETLIHVIKHGDDEFVRGLALAALVKWGEDPDPDRLHEEIDLAEREGLV